jgi:uncharacterized protein (TIGR02444 family)
MAADLTRYWEMMANLYGRGGVADICLDLQDRFGTDVVFLLFLRLLDHQAIHLGESKRCDARAVVTAWHAHVVVQLRAMRQWMKPLAGTAGVASYRNRIKDAELEAEHMELDMLVHWLSVQKLTSVSPDCAHNARDFLLQAGVDRLTMVRFLALTA